MGNPDGFGHWRRLTDEHVRRVLDCAPRLGAAYHELAYEEFCADSAATAAPASPDRRSGCAPTFRRLSGAAVGSKRPLRPG
uniref:Uncharacterized protein n=1 Tax=uncultured Armatimonadetes bacterium TaxID=157466 RepID=A0A6J4IS92_9BACT|nr:hypothetical protein AVDCRST_MAG63-2279 [uncultured Armatimonadetes bacterium]